MLLLPSPGASRSAACGSNNVGQASGGLLYEAGSSPAALQHTHFWACGVRSGWSVDRRQLQRKLSGEAAGEDLWRGSKAGL